MFSTIQLYPANHLNPAHTVRMEWDGSKWTCQVMEGDVIVCETESDDRTVGDIRAEAAARRTYREILAARHEAKQLALA